MANTLVPVSFAPATLKDVTLGEKLAAVVVALKLVAAMPILVVKVLLGARAKSGKSWIYTLRSKILNFALARVHPRQINLLNPPTTVQIRKMAKLLNVTVTTDDISHGAKIHWWGEKKGQKVLLHIHGGGYNLAIGDHHVKYLHQTKEHLKKKGIDADLAILEYSLTPAARYPTQLKQSVEGLRYIIHTCGYDPANIVFAGDSAGGCLVISTVSHLIHPHPAIEPLILPESSPKLGALVPISPWTSFATDYKSMKEANQKDVVFPLFVEVWSRWLVDRPDEPRHKDLPPTDDKYTWDEYNQPSLAPPSWWTGVPVKKTLILIGEEETLCDSIIEFGKTFREGVEKGVPAGESSVDVVVCEGEIHTECFYDMFIPGEHKVPGRMATAWWALCEGVFKE
ncbi:hypothetical protein H072_8068 [Dactylellina haptotyla CBS 200.50]|uniref:Alpha/beta hydrolase fold-3 domain-containing protein n=1 Tax=Dactylellina haptotyla (strain CBS 200.50) TaxID=1284197 RepID=S8BT20_DACHA|nr:hypothetical protein H072_8068 [Dactylellina haptotyla CBS 200.50]